MNKPAPAPTPAILAEAKRQHAILSQGTAAIYPEKGRFGPDGLFDKLVLSLQQNRPLKIKLGADPTRPDLHIGHGLVLDSLKRFQDLGHIAQFLIGGYTTRIGDPTGRNTTRPPLTSEEISANAKTYMAQVFKVLKNDPKTIQILNNEDWLKDLSFADLLKLCAQVTVSQVIQREDFANRLKSGTPVGLHELLYPIMQGYDSVAMDCDIELGGTDQTFNCLMGRQLMQARGMEPQVVITFPLLEGLDGVEKMSKSKDNYIALTDTPENIYGKTMSISDALMERWYKLLAPDVQRPSHPMEAKKALAYLITARFHTPAAAKAAQEEFTLRFSKRENPTEILEVKYNGPTLLPDIIVGVGFAKSKSEARRIIEQGGVKINGEQRLDPATTVRIGSPFLLQVGKLKIAKVTLAG